LKAETLKVLSALGDPTRYAIYHYLVASESRGATAQEVGDAFSIHPNVARLHLTKLEEAGVVESYVQKPLPGGGRPARAYVVADRPPELEFPAREWRLLSEVATSALAMLMPDAAESLCAEGRRHGLALGEASLRRSEPGLVPETGGSPATSPGRLENLRQLLCDCHPGAEVRWQDGGFSVSLPQCPFREVAASQPQVVCQMHLALLQGMVESHLGPVAASALALMPDGCATCDFAFAPAGHDRPAAG